MSSQSAPTAAAPVEGPVCLRHPERAAVGTCERCGRFVCESCAGARRTCPECVSRQQREVPSSAPRARLATRLLSAHAVTDALSILASVWALMSSGPTETSETLEALFGLGALVVIITTAVAFLRWLHLAVRQVQALGHDVGATPGWAVGYWFIPFVNLVRPFQVVRALLTGLGGETLASEARVGLWWSVWIVTTVLSRIESRLALRDGVTPSAHVVGIFSSLASIAAALLCIQVIRAAQRALDAQRA